MQIGFIGLGAMGQHMAANLQLAGHALRVHDVRREAASALVAGGAEWADKPAGAARGVEVLFTCLPGPAEIEAIALGDGGLLGAMETGSVWFDLTTNAPDLVRRLNATFAVHGVRMLDAPVSGGPKGAQSRRLALWVGGDAAVFDQYVPVLKAMGDEALYVGPIGSGSVAKLVHNCANFAVQSALAEVFTLGVKAGVDPLVLFRALRQGTAGRSRTFDRLAEQFLPGIYDPPAFVLRLAHKDMSLAIGLAGTYDVPMRIAEIAMQEITEAMQRGWGERDARIALTLQEERAGVSVHIPLNHLRDVMGGAIIPGRNHKTPAAAMPSSLSSEGLVDRPAASRTTDECLAGTDQTWLYLARFDYFAGLPWEDIWGEEEAGGALACMIGLAAVLLVISAALALFELALY